MVKKRVKEKIYRNLCIIFAVIIIGLVLLIFLPTSAPTTELLPLVSPELSTLGFEKVKSVEVGSSDDGWIVTLNIGCYALAAGVEATQAFSIQNALQNKTAERPNAHDLARDVFNTLNIKVLMVKITELKDMAYHARILLRQGNTLLNFDVRPSDGIAIALRMSSPIYINKTLLEAQGKYIC